MSIPATAVGVDPADWIAAAVQMSEVIEIVAGEFVVTRVGGNPHHYIARRLAEEFERQWQVVAVAPGNWALQTSQDGRILLGRVPDVLVDGEDLLRSEVFRGVPLAVVEVWSPSDTLADMNAKRSEYREAGAPVMVEAFLADAGDVHLEWLVNESSRWRSVGGAAGVIPLVIAGEPGFSVVPNALLNR